MTSTVFKPISVVGIHDVFPVGMDGPVLNLGAAFDRRSGRSFGEDFLKGLAGFRALFGREVVGFFEVVWDVEKNCRCDSVCGFGFGRIACREIRPSRVDSDKTPSGGDSLFVPEVEAGKSCVARS